MSAASIAGRRFWPRMAGALAFAVTGLLFATLVLRDVRSAALFLVGVLLGLTLYHAAFGFTGAYRALFVRREARGVEAQLLMLAAATLLFAPLLARGSALGLPLGGAVAPAGVSVAVGAFLFGVGMQLAGGCASGTIYAAGGGSGRSAVALLAFIAGAFWASLEMGWWQRQPSLGPIELGALLGWPAAATLELALFGLLAWLARRWSRTGMPPLREAGPREGVEARWLRGPWSLTVGALLLASLNAATLILAGHPWTITWGFSLWGAKVAALLGWNPASSAFWRGGFQHHALTHSVLDDVTSVMDIGMLLGAACAACLGGRFTGWRLGVPGRGWLAAVLGGVLMGYGARIAYGCNIGAFFSGVASTSLHGWLWILTGLPGNWVGARLRPRFGLPS